MWTFPTQIIDVRTIKTTVSDASHGLSFREVIDLWVEDAKFRGWFAEQLRQSRFAAYYWETPPVTEQTFDRIFEYVLVDAPPLAGSSADASPFESQFATGRNQEILTFPNLRGDAVLVVPAPVSSADCYAHLAQFVRRAPESQVDALWSAVGNAMKNRISGLPMWLSTAGLGVFWLHVRLDSKPKYYRHGRYTVHP